MKIIVVLDLCVVLVLHTAPMIAVAAVFAESRNLSSNAYLLRYSKSELLTTKQIFSSLCPSDCPYLFRVMKSVPNSVPLSPSARS